MCGIACLIARNGPIRLMRRISTQCSTVCSAIGTSPPLIPALAQIASSLPYVDTALSMKAITSASEPASAWTASAVPPAFRICATVSLTPSARSIAINLAPSLVNRSEAARPMPLPAPVMMTDLPSRRPMRYSLGVLVCRFAEFQTRFQTSNSLEAAFRLAYSDTQTVLKGFGDVQSREIGSRHDAMVEIGRAHV